MKRFKKKKRIVFTDLNGYKGFINRLNNVYKTTECVHVLIFGSQ